VRFAAVHLPEGRALNGKASQTFLRHYNACPRSGYLYSLYKGEASTIEMVRGSALHAILERSAALAVANDAVSVPQEIVKDMVNVVLAEHHVPFEEHDYIRESAYRWAREYAAVPAEVVAIESLIVLRVGGWDVRMKVDHAELLEGGELCHVVDYKSSRSMPAQEDVARKRRDPLPEGGEAAVFLAKNFQLVLYALGLAFGVPVRVETCSECSGSGQAPTADRSVDLGGCPGCGGSMLTPGRGMWEVPEPFSLAGRAQRFDLEFVYPGIEFDGVMARRPMSLTRLELSEYMASLEGLLARVAHSEETGDWPAQVSDDGCGECPAASLCPIPAELRDHRGTINTVEQAAEAQEVLDRRRAEDAAISREIKAFCKAQGIDLRYGRDRVREWKTSEVTKISDRESMFAAMERAVRFGEPFDRGEFVSTKPSTGFNARTLTADELMAEAVERSNGDG
jgi:hypothetical protein